MHTHHHPDLRSPLVLDIHELERRPGTMKRVHKTVPAPAELGNSSIRVPEGSDIVLDLQLESVVEGVWMSGTAEAKLAGECTRCLEPITDEGSYQLEELYFYPGRDADEDASFIVEDTIDLDPALRDAVVLELPFAPLCEEDCAGLCVECGANLNDDPDHHHADKVDSRWEKLAGLVDPENPQS